MVGSGAEVYRVGPCRPTGIQLNDRRRPRVSKTANSKTTASAGPRLPETRRRQSGRDRTETADDCMGPVGRALTDIFISRNTHPHRGRRCRPEQLEITVGPGREMGGGGLFVSAFPNCELAAWSD